SSPGIHGTATITGGSTWRTPTRSCRTSPSRSEARSGPGGPGTRTAANLAFRSEKGTINDREPPWARTPPVASRDAALRRSRAMNDPFNLTPFGTDPPQAGLGATPQATPEEDRVPGSGEARKATDPVGTPAPPTEGESTASDPSPTATTRDAAPRAQPGRASPAA